MHLVTYCVDTLHIQSVNKIFVCMLLDPMLRFLLPDVHNVLAIFAVVEIVKLVTVLSSTGFHREGGGGGPPPPQIAVYGGVHKIGFVHEFY